MDELLHQSWRQVILDHRCQVAQCWGSQAKEHFNRPVKASEMYYFLFLLVSLNPAGYGREKCSGQPVLWESWFGSRLQHEVPLSHFRMLPLIAQNVSTVSAIFVPVTSHAESGEGEHVLPIFTFHRLIRVKDHLGKPSHFTDEETKKLKKELNESWTVDIAGPWIQIASAPHLMP